VREIAYDDYSWTRPAAVRNGSAPTDS